MQHVQHHVCYIDSISPCAGPVPRKLCGATPGSLLSVLILGHNQLTGDLDLGWCNNLVFLDTAVSTSEGVPEWVLSPGSGGSCG